MKVAVGSPNPVKVRAVELAFTQFFGEIDVVSLDTGSGVKSFPDTEEQILEGASNRAERSFSSEVDFSVGIEGGVVLIDGRWFDRNYVVVYDGSETGIGSSASYEVPGHMVERIDADSDESKKIIDESLGVKDVFTKMGVVGVLTKDYIDREKLLTDAVACALTRFIRSDYYQAG